MKSLTKLMEEFESPTGLYIEDMADLGFGSYVTKIGNFYEKQAIDEESASELFTELVNTAYMQDNLICNQDQLNERVEDRLRGIDMRLECAEMTYKFNKK